MNIQTLPVGALGTNCYLLCDETEKLCAVIDPGADARRIAQLVQTSGCTPCAILLTHGHYDHTGAVAELSTLWPEVPVYLSRKDQFPGDGQLCQLFPLLPDTRDYGEGDRIQVGSLTVQVLSTPGHSQGSVSLLCGDALFAGDTLFAGSCGRTDFAGGDLKTIMSSLRRLGQLKGDLRVFPGHMDASTLEEERKWNPYLIHAMRG